MKVILQENIEGVGHLGDLLDVSNGYARNYLIPRKKAVEANPRSIKAFEHMKRAAADKAQKEKLEVEGYGKKVSAVSLTLTVQSGKDDKLFGSVTAKDIAEALADKGFEIDRRKIQMAHPIKELGTFTIPIKLHHQVTATIAVTVKKQEADEPAAAEA